MEGKAVLKTFWSWRRVGVPKGWREALADAERGVAPSKGEDTVWGRGVRPGVVRRRGSWWTGEGEEERTNCVVM